MGQLVTLAHHLLHVAPCSQRTFVVSLDGAGGWMLESLGPQVRVSQAISWGMQTGLGDHVGCSLDHSLGNYITWGQSFGS